MIILLEDGTKVDIETVPSADNRYAVDRKGNVYSLVRRTPMRLSPVLNSDGYLKVSIHFVGQKRKLVSIHRIVAEVFVPADEGRDLINHKNGIKTDNRAENLEWVTSSENIGHAMRTGLFTPPYHNGFLDKRLVDRANARSLIARSLRENGSGYKEISEIIGCSISTAHNYVHRETQGGSNA